MKKVYICSLYRGDTKTNVQNARKYCREAVKLGCVPIAPHLLFPQFMDDGNPEEREVAIEMDFELIDICAEVWVFGLNDPSEGMSEEIHWAEDAGIPVLDGFGMIGESEKRTMENFSDQEIIDELVRRAKDDRISIKVRADESGVNVDYAVEG